MVRKSSNKKCAKKFKRKKVQKKFKKKVETKTILKKVQTKKVQTKKVEKSSKKFFWFELFKTFLNLFKLFFKQKGLNFFVLNLFGLNFLLKKI